MAGSDRLGSKELKLLLCRYDIDDLEDLCQLPNMSARVQTSFVQELKRRNVVRVGVLYMVSAWLLLQLTDVLSSLLSLPQWAGSFVILLLALGFFPVLIFAWVYEMTPQGLKREADVDPSHSVTTSTGKKINTVIVVLLVLAIGGLIADRLVPETSVEAEIAEIDSTGSTIVSVDRSIAVLPFADLSPEQDQQYFTDGLSEELLNVLVRVDGLRVASRTSSFAYRGSTIGIPEIARALNVRHILEGSVRKDGENIRITAQLIETETDGHLWSETYNRKLIDIFAIQDEIANAIVDALAGEIGSQGVKAVTVEAATDNFEAYEMYLKARELFIRRSNLTESIRLFQKAIELDPDFARAWEGLAAVEAIADDWIQGPDEDGIKHGSLAEQPARKAISLDPDLSMPLAVLGQLSSRRRNDLVEALNYYEAAIDKDTKNTSAWLWKGVTLKYTGYLDEAIVAFEQCLAIDPAYLNCGTFLAETYLFIGMLDKALTLHDEMIESTFLAASPSFVSYYVRNGQRNLALLLAAAKMRSHNAPVLEWIIAIENPNDDNSVGLARLKDWARTTGNGMELPPQMLFSFRAYDEMLEIGEMQRRMLFHPDAQEFRTTPQFKQIVRERGFFVLWQERGFPPGCRAIGDDDFECGGLALN